VFTFCAYILICKLQTYLLKCNQISKILGLPKFVDNYLNKALRRKSKSIDTIVSNRFVINHYCYVFKCTVYYKKFRIVYLFLSYTILSSICYVKFFSKASGLKYLVMSQENK